MQSLGTRLKYTEQYCMSNIIIATHLDSSTVMPYMHTSQRVKGWLPQEYRQLSLEKKPLSSHNPERRDNLMQPRMR